MVRAVHRDGNEVIPRKIGRRKKRRIADEGSEGSRNGVFVDRPGIDSMGPQDPGQGNLGAHAVAIRPPMAQNHDAHPLQLVEGACK